MNDLVFKYDEYAEEYTIDNVNIHIPKGKITAIVGASGSGKTTLTKMMLGYYEPLRGKLKIGVWILKLLIKSGGDVSVVLLCRKVLCFLIRLRVILLLMTIV